MVEFISMPGRRYEIYAARIGTLAQRGEIFDATILKIKIFDLFQILVAKPLKMCLYNKPEPEDQVTTYTRYYRSI